MTSIEKPKKKVTDLLELRGQLAHLSANKRLAAILERPDVIRVVRSLPPQDLYATMREVDLEDSLELLELCHPRQVQLFLDLDGWKRDRIDPIAHLAWIRAMLTANPDRAISQLRGLDVELITLLMKVHTRVYDLSAEEEPDEDMTMNSVTPDNRYLVVYDPATADETTLLTLKEAFERLMGRDMLFVLRLCEAVRWEMPSALEEDAFRFRNGRISDMGFVPTHEALEIFAFVDPDKAMDRPATSEWRRPKPEVQHDGDPITDLSTSVLLPWDLFEDGGTALGRALQGLDDEGRARVAHELMMTANRLHMAEAGDPGDPEALKTTVRAAANTVGIAVAYLSKGDAARLVLPLQRLATQRLFQVGYSLAVRLQREVKQRIQGKDSGLDGNGLLRLDAPLRELVAGLLRSRPQLYAGLLDQKRVDFRPFESLGDLAATAQALSEASFRGAFVGKRGLGADDARLATFGVTDPASMPSHGAILAAALARAVLAEDDAPLSAAPLAPDALTAFVRLARAPGGVPPVRIAKARAAAEALARARAPFSGAQSPDEAAKRAGAYAAQVLAAMVEESAKLDDDSPDPRFISTMWTQR